MGRHTLRNGPYIPRERESEKRRDIDCAVETCCVRGTTQSDMHANRTKLSRSSGIQRDHFGSLQQNII